MLDAINTHHRWQLFLSGRQRTGALFVGLTQSNWVKMWLSCFRVLPGRAEAQVIWGGIVKRLLIAYFIGNISAKKYQNPFMCVKVIASQWWDVFWDTVYSYYTVSLGATITMAIYLCQFFVDLQNSFTAVKSSKLPTKRIRLPTTP